MGGSNCDLYLIPPCVSDLLHVRGKWSGLLLIGQEKNRRGGTDLEKDRGAVSMLQQETLQSAFNHDRPLLHRPSRQRGGGQQGQVLQSLPSDKT